MIQAVLFDFNGVIIDDEKIQYAAYREVLAGHGIDLTEADYFASLGMDDLTFVRATFARAGRASDEELSRRIIEAKTAAHRQLIADELPLFPGVVTLLKELARRYTLGLVSMARRTEIEHVLGRARVEKIFAVIVSAEDVTVCKPDPSCYLRALELLNAERRARRQLPLLPVECVVFEDSPPGVRSARGAGMRTIGVTNTVPERELREAGAEVVTPSLFDWTADAVHHLFDAHKHP